LAIGVGLPNCTRRQEQANDPKQRVSSHEIKSDRQSRVPIPKSLSGRHNATISFDGTLPSSAFAKNTPQIFPGTFQPTTVTEVDELI